MKNLKQNESYSPTSIAGFIGMTVMTTAAVVSMLELHDVRMPRMATTMQPAYAHANEHTGSGDQSSSHRMEERVRREKEETRHALVSYGVMMRSHPTAGHA